MLILAMAITICGGIIVFYAGVLALTPETKYTQFDKKMDAIFSYKLFQIGSFVVTLPTVVTLIVGITAFISARHITDRILN